MPAPVSPASFGRPDLGEAYEEFDLMSHVQGFIGLRCMPITPVGLQSASFSKVQIKELLNDGRNLKRAPGGGYARQEWDVTTDNYATEERGAEELLDDRERAAFGWTGIRFEQLAADRAVSALLRDLEIEIQAILQDATTYSSQLTNVGTEWDTIASSKVVSDVLTARESFKGVSGVYPNGIALSEKVATNAIQSAELKDFIKYNPSPFGSNLPGDVLGVPDMLAKTSEVLAMAWRIPNVLISPSVKNTANAGQSATIGDIWNDEYVSLIQIPQGDDVRSMGFGRTFAFENMVVEQYREEKNRSDVIRARFDLDVKVIQSTCLWILGNITT